ncbi:MAG TPA: hypothetical protein VFE72_10500 [Lysobacter sp.]|nr:hypothetical protein [Lysobacter sp.]
MAFDFPNAQLPRLLPLEASFAENEVEAELKALFLSIFDSMLAPAMFDVNVLGTPHLGSSELVRRAVNMDGLMLLQGDREEAATRYLYRAWKSGNTQGRGLHFLRTYLQLLFPNQCRVEQLWQAREAEYPEGGFGTRPGTYVRYPALDGQYNLDGSWGVGSAIESSDGGEDVPFADDELDYWLTSRVMIAMSFESDTQSVRKLASVIGSVLPARLVPVFRFWLKHVVEMRIGGSSGMRISKSVTTSLGGLTQLYVTDNTERQFFLGLNEEPRAAEKLVVAGISGDYRMRVVR